MTCLALALLLKLTAAQAQSPRVFGIVVGNNRSSAPGRSALDYADDDAAKYAVFLSLFTDEGDVQLLSEFDRDTEGLFPSLTPSAPTMAGVNESFERVRDQVAQAHSRGQASEVFFIFAGHGDVEAGQGYLELIDGRLDAPTLRGQLATLRDARVHVIIDSCNSFFVVAPRKPGGKRFITPADVTADLSRDLPNVGVILSTSAEAEVYEWSELQSGIFSHLVRSGGMGAADANADGQISYLELAAFITVASRSVPNPQFRPQVFVRGPLGNQGEIVLRTKSSRGVQVVIDEPENARVTVRDSQGLRWADAHAERGVPLTLRVPWAVARSVQIERSSGARLAEHFIGPSEPPEVLNFRELTSARPRTSRGAHEQLEQLFAEPFGPTAMRVFGAQPEPVVVFGLSKVEAHRVRLLVETFAAVQRNKHRAELLALAAPVVATAVTSTVVAAESGASASQVVISPLITGGLLTGIGAAVLYGAREKQLIDLAQRLGERGDLSRPYAELEFALHEYAEADRCERRAFVVAGALVGGLGVIALIASELLSLTPPERTFARTTTLSTVVFGGSAIAFGLLTRGEAAEMVRLWDEDPARWVSPNITVAPLAGGVMVGLSGRF